MPAAIRLYRTALYNGLDWYHAKVQLHLGKEISPRQSSILIIYCHRMLVKHEASQS